MGRIVQRAGLFLVVPAILLLAANIVWGQEYTTRLKSPAIVRSVIGGESHDSYVIRARKGQVMTVKISWRREHDQDMRNNHAEFWVGELPNFDGDGLVKFGNESNDGKRWSGKIPKTADYYIYVTAHPIAHYTIRVTVK
jgi:hypothetical protein